MLEVRSEVGLGGVIMIEKIIEKLTAKCREWYEIWDANHDDEYAERMNV